MNVVDTFFQPLFESAPHPYLILHADETYTIAAVNDYYLNATGIKREDVIDKGIFEVFPDNPADNSTSSVSDLHISLDRVVRYGKTDTMGVQKYDIPKRDGSGEFEVKYWSPVNAPVFAQDGSVSYIIHNVEDVTDFILLQQASDSSADISQANRPESEVLKRANEVKEANRQIKAREEELVQLNEKLKELDKIKTEFFSNVSHEFRTPLTLILAPIEEMLAKVQEMDSEKISHNLEIVHRNVLRLLKLVNTLLDFSKVEAGREKASWELTDLSAFTADLASNFSSACDLGKVKLIVDCPPLDQQVQVDKNMWEKIVLNLISNAFKFTHTGTITVSMSAQDGYANLKIKDSGIGIEKEELAKIFERFYRVQNTQGRSYEGTGIGLSLVKELVLIQDGKIDVSSEVGVGTTFTVSIPFGVTHELSSKSTNISLYPDAFVSEALRVGREQKSIVAKVKEGKSKGKVVLADDNLDMREYLSRLLVDAGYNVTTAVDGQEALLLCQNALPDLLLSDVMMPVMDGYSLLKAIRSSQETDTLPFILLSAKAGEEAKTEGLIAGADDYIVKPFHANELLARIESAVNLGKFRKKAQEKIRHEREFIAAILDISAALIIVLDADGRIVHFNKMCEKLSGYEAVEMVGFFVWERLILSEQVQGVRATFENLKNGDFPNSYENYWLAKDGQKILVRWSNTAMCDSDGKVDFIIATGIDITQAKINELKLQLSAKVIENMSEAVMTTDMQGNVVSINPAFTKITGFDSQQILNQNSRILKSDKHDKAFYEKLWQTITSGSTWHGEIWDKHRAGELYLTRATITPIIDEQGVILHYVYVCTDITEEKAKQETISYQAHHDILTGLPNRLLFVDRLSEALKLAKRNQSSVALMYIDLDKFKYVNDTYGHIVGDILLKEVTTRIKECIRETDTVARMGGDEFTAIFASFVSHEDIKFIAQKIVDALAKPFYIQMHELNISCSIGISFYPSDDMSEEGLMKLADKAMYQAKESGKNKFVIYSN